MNGLATNRQSESVDLSAFIATNKFRERDFTGVMARRPKVTILRVADDPLKALRNATSPHGALHVRLQANRTSE